jgi:hypothetical protein
VRIYSASSQEILRARDLLKDWADEGHISKEQYRLLQQETISELRTTNIFLRLVLFLFTLLIVGAGFGLFLVILSHPSDRTAGVVCLIFAGVCYVAAEGAVSRARLYRYGIEEALTVCSVGFLCAGLLATFFSGSLFSSRPDAARFLIPAAGAVFSLWIWRRFGFSYAFLAVMIFALFLPGDWTSSHAGQRVIVALFYAAGLACVVAVRSRHRFDYLDEGYSLVEAMLWLGIYLVINLQLSSLALSARWWGGVRATSEFTAPFYWSTWVVIWCLPAIVLARGFHTKDRFVIAAGAIAATLTLVSNKPYLGWPRHTWDPMLLGLWLTVVAVFVRRWLDLGPGGIRHGLTAARLSGNDKQWMNFGPNVLGLISPQSITPAPQTSDASVHFGGGHSGGGGASSEF